MTESLFADVRLLDCGTDIPGPYCAKLFADYGADVIKVEPPQGDPARALGPFPGDIPHPEKSGIFLYLNTNKRGITLDRGSDAGRERLEKLVAWADIVIENGLPGAFAADGFGWARLQEINPRLVLTSISPFGQTGPYREYTADEITLFAMSGRMWIHGLADRQPLRYGPDMAWFQVGQTAAVATLAALFAARRFGIGQHVDVSALEALAGNVDARNIFYSMTGTLPVRPPVASATSLTGVVACKDGFIMMIAAGERFFRRLMRAIGSPELADDERFSTAAARQQNAGELDAVVLPWLAERTRREAFEQLQAYSVMCAPIQTADEVFEDPQLRARRFFQEVVHPAAGKLPYAGVPFVTTAAPGAITRPAPLLGQHNAEVFESLLDTAGSGAMNTDQARVR